MKFLNNKLLEQWDDFGELLRVQAPEATWKSSLIGAL
jgi:hypothetical protein